MARTEIYSVEVERPHGPLQAWEDALSAHVGRVDPSLRAQEATRCISADAARFFGRVEHGALGDVLICRVTTTAYRLNRALTTTAPTLPVPAMLVLVSSGSCRFLQGGRACTLGRGDWTLIDTKRPFDYLITSAEFRAFVLMLPPPSDTSTSALLQHGVAHRWSGRTGLSRVMHGLVSETFSELGRLAPTSGQTLGIALTAITWDALREQIETPLAMGRRDQQSGRVKTYIEAQIADPELSVEEIAEACNISLRGLHRLFADDASGSVSRYLWNRRLARCADALRDPAQVNRSITDVCFSYGFNSTSHFSRQFKDRFGVPPIRYREAALLKTDGPVSAAAEQAAQHLSGHDGDRVDLASRPSHTGLVDSLARTRIKSCGTRSQA